jgi:hypothetical protein
VSRAADNRRYVTQRTLAILLMGSKCKYCPERRPWRLEFHHTRRVDWCPAKTSRCRRIRRYIQDWSNGICVLDCGTCNKRQGQPEESAVEELPF